MKLTIRPGLSLAETEYGMVLLDGADGRYWTLNPSGCVVVKALGDGGGLDAAAAALVAEFDIDPDTAALDAVRLVDQLSAAGLLVGSGR